jgi:hypothetical protein
MVGANIISALFALNHLSKNPMLPTTRSLRTESCSIIKGTEVIHDVPVWHKKVKITLDFHVFEVHDFDVLIGHSIEKLFLDVSALGTLDVTIGGRSYTLLIAQSKNSLAELLPQEVLATVPVETSDTSLEEDVELFIQEKDDLGETLELPTREQPTCPPIELRPRPSGLRYAFLKGDTESPIIISDKLSDEETAKLIAILEKHRAIFGYSLQDLKGISQTLCTHSHPYRPSQHTFQGASTYA